VVDLCPVGALTHARWRFNTRIWYTKEIDTVCPGCSTGCSAKVAVRDGEVVFVKGRLNSEVNKEWLCNEGRYGFSSFQPERRLLSPLRRQGFALEEAPMREILNEAAGLLGESQGDTAVFLSPRLTLEEIWTALRFCEQVLGIERQSPSIAMQCVRRKLSELESLLISPDYAPNVRAMELLGASPEGADWRESAEERYFQLLRQVKKGFPSRILLVGDGAIRDEDFDENLYEVLLNASCSISLGSRGLLEGEGEETDSVGAHQLCKILFPSRTVNEKSGVFVSCGLRLQRLNRLLDPPSGSLPEWQLLYSLAEACSVEVLSSKPSDERTLFLAMTREEPALSGLTLRALGEFGLDFQDRVSAQQEGGMR
jgi:NADH-quinone oxidoreductase subunit G